MSSSGLWKRLSGLAAVLCLAGIVGCAPPQTMKSDARSVAIDSRHVLLSAFDDKDEFIRAEAVEALGQTLGADGGNIYMQAMQDTSPVVRFAATIVVGDLKYAPAKPMLMKMAGGPPDGERDKRVFAGAVYALYTMGNTDHVAELSPLLFDPEPEVRANVALVMGKMGNVQAMLPLKALRSGERIPSVQIQLKDSLGMLGDPASVDSLEGYARSSIYVDERVPAIQSLAKIRDRQAVYLLRNMVRPEEPLLVRLATAGALSQLGHYSPEGYELCVRTVQDPVPVLSESMGGKVEIRPEDAAKAEILAAISLGHMGNVLAVDSLKPVLRSADGLARVAAAKSILTLLPAYQRPERSEPQPSAPPIKPEPPVVKPSPPPVKPVPPVVTPPPATKPAPPVVKPPPPIKPAPPVVTPPPPATKPAVAAPTTTSAPAQKPSTTRPKLISSGAKD
jgi:HEAT repeat protein